MVSDSDRARHSTFEQLVDFVDGRVEPTTRTTIGAHVAQCTTCKDTVSWLERAVTLMRAPSLEDAPDYAIASASRLLRLRTSAEPIRTGPLRRIVAALQFDSAQRRMATGMRSASPSDTRQVMFNAGEYDLDLRVKPGAAGYTVTGQLLGPGDDGWIELKGQQGAVRTDLNELGEFELVPIPGGDYDLVLHCAEIDIEVRNLRIEG